jgi:hypothetical protein
MMAIESWKISNILWGLPTNDEGKITLCLRLQSYIYSFASFPIVATRP